MITIQPFPRSGTIIKIKRFERNSVDFITPIQWPAAVRILQNQMESMDIWMIDLLTLFLGKAPTCPVPKIIPNLPIIEVDSADNALCWTENNWGTFDGRRYNCQTKSWSCYKRKYLR